MPTDYRDPPAVWSIYGAHAAVMLRCGPAVMVAPAPGRVFVLSGADHVDLNQVALYRPAGRELATETVSLAFDAGVPVLLAVSSTVSEDVSDALATGGFLRTSKREALFWSPHLAPEADSPFVIERVATGRTHAAARFVFASVHGYSAAMVDAAYGPRLLAHNDVDAWGRVGGQYTSRRRLHHDRRWDSRCIRDDDSARVPSTGRRPRVAQWGARRCRRPQ